MDYFSLFLDGICLLGQGVMHFFFVVRLTGKKPKALRFAVYILLLLALQLVSVRLSLSGTLSIAAGMLELYAVSRFGMENQPSVSWLAAVLAFYVSQLSFGMLNSVEAALFPRLIGSPLLYLLLLAAQVLFFALCTLYAYGHLCRGFQAQAAHAQKVYIAEARLRYEQTRSFRHDVRNHLSVLDGLLRSGKLEEGRAYLKKLETVSESLSFPCQTGNPVVDVLLGEKLGLAKEISSEVSLVLPKPCGIDDFDLCVIFSNALDNAIAACRSGGGDPVIRIGGERQGDFYLLTFENSCPEGPPSPAGTGLSNIRAVAEKYHGAVLTEKNGGWFCLSVLMNIASAGP